MGRHKQPPEYFAARRALNQHLYHHHDGLKVEGMLAARLTQHEELHIVAKRLKVELGHTHEPCEDGEDDIALAHRLLTEGEAAHGQADTADR